MRGSKYAFVWFATRVIVGARARTIFPLDTSMKFATFGVLASFLSVAFSALMTARSLLRQYTKGRLQNSARLASPCFKAEDSEDDGIEETERRFGSFSCPVTHACDSWRENLLRSHRHIPRLPRSQVSEYADSFADRKPVCEGLPFRVPLFQKFPELQKLQFYGAGRDGKSTSTADTFGNERTPTVHNLLALERAALLSTCTRPKQETLGHMSWAAVARYRSSSLNSVASTRMISCKSKTSMKTQSPIHRTTSVHDLSDLEGTALIAPSPPSETADEMPLLGSLMYPSVISARVYPSETLSDCFDVMLKIVRSGACSTRSFRTMIKLIEDVGEKNRAALEVLLASAVFHLLIARRGDDEFKASGFFEDAFGALVQLMDNSEISTWATQPEILEVVDWIARKGSMASQENVTNFLRKMPAID